MDFSRRRFCRISILGALGAILFPSRTSGITDAPTRRLHGKCRLEVIRCQCFEELQGRYLSDPEAGPCSRFKVGDTIDITPSTLTSVRESGRICPHAWRAVEPYVMAALSAGEITECATAELSTETIVSCPDGTRPVIFKVSSL